LGGGGLGVRAQEQNVWVRRMGRTQKKVGREIEGGRQTEKLMEGRREGGRDREKGFLLHEGRRRREWERGREDSCCTLAQITLRAPIVRSSASAPMDARFRV
jgi:hypothetical protein